MTFLSEKETSSKAIKNLKKYIEEEQFETDSIHMDIEDNIGNIANKMQNKTMMILINQFITTNKSM